MTSMTFQIPDNGSSTRPGIQKDLIPGIAPALSLRVSNIYIYIYIY